MKSSQRKSITGSWTIKLSATALLLAGLSFLPSLIHAQPASGLFGPQASFNFTNRLVSVSVFQWFSANGGQLSGPWRPVEGRANWAGTTNFWRSQIKQMMAANFDLLYVHLIPSSEAERANLFLALNQLRREGWNVPKVAPFLDPMITWNQQPLVDVNTAAGKDTFGNQYIRWFNQYYSVNTDAYADDFLARINGRPVLDTWHLKFNLANLDSLSRADVESRLQSAFAASHPLFTNRIYMVTTALNDPTLAWADEKVPQFEINQYYYAKVWNGLRTVQLKGGYWDQNIRNPGDFLARNGGLPYSNAWSQVNRTLLSRVYVESWNEYDEGSGIYAANTGLPYIKPGSGNTNTDVWSRTNDAYEYIHTTARGATAFNDWPDRDAKILWHNIPTRLLPGETRAATVIVRNEGDAFWSEAAKYRFGQKDTDPVKFGAGRYLVNDTQDDIPTFGGIFRGRPKTFTLSVQAPTTPGLYTNHWSMLQENVTWFGQSITQAILVDSTPVYHGTPQAMDSTDLLTNRVDDLSEHTYVAHNLTVGSFADCAITRTFAAPIKSIKLSSISGTADDVGYVGNILVTPDSANVTCRLGHVTNVVDVTSAVSVNGNTVSLTLRAKDTCCCDTGWGEDSASGRLNAKLHWQVELAPPVPFGQGFTNPDNGHFYALLTPATWTWSERAAVAVGGHLTTIRSQAEQTWVFNTLAGYGGVNRLLWIGLNDVATEGRFVWSSGAPVTFTNWAPGEPNNTLGGEDFVTMYQPGHAQAGRWNDWGQRVFSGSQPFNGVLELVAPMGPPVITTQPGGGRVNPGAVFAFVVAASGSPALTYQWRFNGLDIPGATDTTFTLTNLDFSMTGDYSVRVTNALGSVESSTATLVVNHAPVADDQEVRLSEDTVLNMTLAAGDEDGDWLHFDLISRPAHGLVTIWQIAPLPGVPPTNSVGWAIYRPARDYFGPDSFTFKVSDGMVDSAPVVVRINVEPVNDPPVAYFQSVTLDEDTPTAITLGAFDVENDPLTYTVGAPAHGTLAGTAPNLTYRPETNYFGPDSFTFSLSDGQTNSGTATVSITVVSVNDPPVAKIVVSPLVQLPGITNRVVIAEICGDAEVVLDASGSSDVENDPLTYSWVEGTNVFAQGVTVTNEFDPGVHELVLLLSDGQATTRETVTVEVVKPEEAVGAFILFLIQNENRHNRETLRSLIHDLREVMEDMEHCHARDAVEGLRKSAERLEKLERSNPVLAAQLKAAVKAILEAVDEGRHQRHRKPPKDRRG